MARPPRAKVFVSDKDEVVPHRTWRTTLVYYFMRAFRRQYHHKLFFGEKDGTVRLMITTPTGEIIAQCAVVNPDLLANLVEHTRAAEAQAKLVKDG